MQHTTFDKIHTASAAEDRREVEREKPCSALDVLQRKHSIRLLEYLDGKDEVMLSDVQRDVIRGRNLDEMLEDYESLGIVRRRYDRLKEKPRKVATLLSMTDVGSSFLRMLREADRCVTEQICLDPGFEEYVNEHAVPNVEYGDERKRTPGKPL